MNRAAPFFVLAVTCLPLLAQEFSGNVAAELQLFTQDSQYPDQLKQNLSFSFKPKMVHGWNRGNDEISLELFFRLDDKDAERQHADIREFRWLHVSANHEWRIGVDTVFWGVTESQHLVDVVNQIDRVEGLDGEDKLGQPMIHYTGIQDWGVLDIFVLTGFREAGYHSAEGRLRPPLVVDASQSSYESSDEDRHIDYALRYSHAVGDTEFGLSAFKGTSRQASFSVGNDSNGEMVLLPYYAQMTQLGLDLQSIIGDWIWKLEMIRRELDPVTYNAATFGFEYTFYGIMDSAVDMGTLLEYSWEDRGVDAGVFDNDLFAGLRLAFNDVQSSELLAGILLDTEYHSQSVRVEASRRVGDSWKVSGELQLFSSVDEEDPLHAFARDDFFLIEMARYF